LILYLKEIR